MDLALYAFPAPRAHLGEPELNPGQVGERVVFLGRPALDGRLVPVAAQQRKPGPFAGEAAEELRQAGVVP